MTTEYQYTWPYDLQATEELLDPARIDQNGHLLLYRGLNTRRLMAFVGAGISAAYGRVTWNELARRHANTLVERYAGDEKVEKDDRQSIIRQLQRIKDLTPFPSEQITLILQLCEQFWMLTPLSDDSLKNLARLFWRADVDYEDLRHRYPRQPRLGSQLFRHSVKRETFDESAHITRLLFGDQSVRPKSGTPSSKFEFDDPYARIERDILGFDPALSLSRSRVERQRRSYVFLFQPEAANVLKESMQTALNKYWASTVLQSDAFKIVGETLLKILSRLSENKNRLIPPVRYFALGLVLDLLRYVLLKPEPRLPNPGVNTEDEKVTADSKNKILEIISQSLEEAKNHAKYCKNYKIRPTRTDIIDNRDDPIFNMAMDLQINRYATTNYDLELERFFFDIGFTPPVFDISDDTRSPDSGVGPLGSRSRDIDLSEGSVTDLIDFATDNERYNYQVAHLHGRATTESELVVTERDYQTTYLRDGVRTEAFREGLDIAFGGNPILFAGVGLSEGDILRPLREFVSEQTRRNRAVIALRDASELAAKRDAFTMEQYARYGAHVLHYGFRSDLEQESYETEEMDAKGKDRSWLCRLISRLGEFEAAIQTPKALKIYFAKFKNLESFENEMKEPRLKSGADLSRGFSDKGEFDVELEIATLDIIQRLSKEIVDTGEIDLAGDEYGAHRDLFKKIMPEALGRIRAAILAAALNAKLRGIRLEWEEWWNTWRTTPMDRIERISYDNSGGSRTPLWGRDILYDRKNPPVESQSFRYATGIHRARTGRRCLVLASPKGYGKGYLFSYLATSTEISSRHREKYDGQLFHNFSFATEIASLWDALPSFLLDPHDYHPLGAIEDIFRARKLDISAQVFKRMSRLERLKYAIRQHSRVTQPGHRALIALNSCEVLFYSNGKPKHEEIGEIFKVLLSEEHKDSPLDILLLLRDYRMPFFFRMVNDGRNFLKMPLALLRNNDLDSADEEMAFLAAQRIAQTLADSGVQLVPSQECLRVEGAAAIRRMTEPDNSNVAFLHVLPAPHAAIFRREGISTDGPYHGRLGLLARIIDPSTPDEKRNLESCMKTADDFLTDQLGSYTYAFVLIIAIVRDLWTKGQGREGKKTNEITRNALKKVAEFLRDHKLAPIVRRMKRQRQTEWHRIVTWLRNDNAVEEAKDVEEDVRTAQRAIQTIKLDGAVLAGVPVDHFFEVVLDYWYHRKGGGRSRPWRDPDLLELLIRHLAVIAAPVDANVLAECPQIVDRVQELRGPFKLNRAETPYVRLRKRRKIVRNALKLLYERRLVLKVGDNTEQEQPDGDNTEQERPVGGNTEQGQPDGGTTGQRKPDTDSRTRYQVQRSMQVHVYRRLGANASETPESYLFAPSLYMTQTRDLPHLNASAYKFLYELVDELIGYPSSKRIRQEVGLPREPEVQTRCLRAGLGIVRTLFSLGVVTRFADAEMLPFPHPPRMGYLEHHRLSVRWILELANELEANRKKKEEEKQGKDKFEWAKSKWIPPLYRDETVWLYNECGVFSLAQGQTFDAKALFEQALRLQKQIEGPQGGPMCNRIRLNYGICQIDRGRLKEAGRIFADLMKHGNPDSIVAPIAKACAGMVAHVSGDIDRARKHYDEAIAEIENRGRRRALALVYRQRGDLYRHLGLKDNAFNDFRSAIQVAEAGGYTDLIHQLRIAEIRCRARVDGDWSHDGLHWAQLDDADDYADRMDIPRLKCEVLMVRGEIQMLQREMRLAAEFITRAIQIASLNGLALRRIGALYLLEKVYRMRKDPVGADRIGATTTQTARAIGYNLRTVR